MATPITSKSEKAKKISRIPVRATIRITGLSTVRLARTMAAITASALGTAHMSNPSDELAGAISASKMNKGITDRS